MRKAIILMFLCISVAVNATTYYVATNGSNSNNGTTTSTPWLTLQYGIDHVKAGDILYIRGGTYRTTGNASSSALLTMSGMAGTSSSHITVSAYPGEVPVLNLDNITTNQPAVFALFMNGSTYLDLKGLTVTGLAQPSSATNVAGFYTTNSSHITIENCVCHHMGGYGFTCNNSTYVTYKNCDAHHCADPYSANGAWENANGFGVTGGVAQNTSDNIAFDGCRSWNNADDGFDFYGVDAYITVNNCWSFYNGYDDSFNPEGNGQGFKLGPNYTTTYNSTVRRVITNCVAAGNKYHGFDQNYGSSWGTCRMNFYNNTAFGNAQMGWAFNYISGIDNIFKNNIAVNNTAGTANVASSTQDHNSWNGTVTASAADFQSTTISQLTSARQSDGSLPVLTTFHLAAGSDLINAGVDAGLPFTGTAPDMGAFETGTVTSVQVPAFSSAAVENATPSILTMTYNMTLANIVPAASAFTVLVNSVARAVNSVVVSGTNVQLTLANPVVYGDNVTISYTKPSVNPVQISSGGQAESTSGQTVTNRVNAINPVYVSSAVANTTPSLLEMSYNMSLANIVPTVTSFSVLINSVARTVNAVAISGTKVQLTLQSRIVYGDIVNVSYTKPAVNFLQTATGGAASGISKLPVTNNCINLPPTAVLTSPVANSSFTSQANISITANASDADGSVNLVEFYNGSTKLGSASAAPYSLNWDNVAAGTYSLTAIATDNQNARTVSPAVSISVLNKTTTPNKHPIIHIYNPNKGTSYDNLSTVTIDAVASDPDGTISKVEFYNGSEKMVELTSDPYTYTWKDVAAGTYYITAIATDNLNDTTKSSPIELVVGTRVKYDANSDVIKLYPNPNNGHFTIEFVNPLLEGKSEIIITDMGGKQVYNGPVLQEEIVKQFDLSGSRSGVYVMMIKDKDILVTKKFIKN